jgi:hypothetical protein
METEGGVMKIKSSRRLVRRLGLALAVTALMVPTTAQAMTMNASYESGGGFGVRLYADDLHAMIPPVKTQRIYADDLHASLAPAAVRVERQYADDLHASLVSAPVQRQRLYADDLHSNPPVSAKPGNFEPINTRARPDLRPAVSAVVPTDSTSSDWSVAIIGAAVGAFGVMLLGLTLLLAGRHGRKGRLAAT